MPYQGERADPSSIVALVDDPQIREQIGRWVKVPLPSDLVSALDEITRPVDALPAVVDPSTVTRSIAIDGSPLVTDEEDELRSTVGVVSVGTVFTDHAAQRTAVLPGGFVDQAVYAAATSVHRVSGAVPGARVALRGRTGLDTWRDAVETFLGSKTVHPNSAVTLSAMAVRIFGEDEVDPATGEIRRFVFLRRCPVCRVTRIGADLEQCKVSPRGGMCLHGHRLYVSDVLGLDEGFDPEGSNWDVLTRLMNMTERLLTAGCVEHLVVLDPGVLAETLVVTDGPLGIFGQQSWANESFARYYASVDERLAAQGRPPLLMVGVEKSGAFHDHAQRISHLIDPGTVVMPSNEYIVSFIQPSLVQSSVYGAKAYYGRRFFAKDTFGTMRVFGVTPSGPHPAGQTVRAYSASAASESWETYRTIGVVARVLEERRSSQYDGAISPLIAAHQATSIPIAGRNELRALVEQVMGESDTPVPSRRPTPTEAGR